MFYYNHFFIRNKEYMESLKSTFFTVISRPRSEKKCPPGTRRTSSSRRCKKIVSRLKSHRCRHGSRRTRDGRHCRRRLKSGR